MTTEKSEEELKTAAVHKARELYGSTEIEFDEQPVTSVGDDGVWVQGWLLVKNEELDLENLSVENEIVEEE